MVGKSSPRWDVSALLNAAESPGVKSEGSIAERHLWLVRLLQWLRAPRRPQRASARASDGVEVNDSAWPTTHDAAKTGGNDAAVHPALTRLKLLLNILDHNEGHRRQVQALFASFWRDVDALSLLVDYGLGPRVSFRSELATRLSEKLLPASPETRSLATLFRLVFEPSDDAWIEAIDDVTMTRVIKNVAPLADEAVRSPADADTALARASSGPSANETVAGGASVLFEAMTALAAAITADGLSSRLRHRMDQGRLSGGPFRQLGPAVERLRVHVQAGAEGGADEEVKARSAAEALQSATYLRALLNACRQATDSVRQHLDEHGVSVDIVFACEQVHERAARLEALLDVAMAHDAARGWQSLVVQLLRDVLQRRGLRGLLRRQTHQLARSVTERNAEVGEHYIARDRAQWRAMFQRALGGGVVVAGTTVLKFAVAALALLPFWEGVANGLNYAASFIVIMLLHWTLATKQPAMTAPVLAAQVGDVTHEAGLAAFVDTVVQLIRSQVAGVMGNLSAVLPLVLIVQAAFAWITGAPLMSEGATAKVLPSLSIAGPTLLYAAFTGVLLFISSLIAGWVENWFVFRRLDSAIAWNPRIVGMLGSSRAQRLSRWWRAHISGLAGNVSLGLLLGLVPVVLAFVGIGLEARHVTLSMGQVAAAVGARGLEVFSTSDVWWAIAAVPLIGALNLLVSFWLAFTLALRARGVRVKERERIYRALVRRFIDAPLSFFVAPRATPEHTRVPN